MTVSFPPSSDAKTRKTLLQQVLYLLIPLLMLGLFLMASLSEREDPAASVRALLGDVYAHYATDNGPPTLNDAVLASLLSPALLTLWQQGQDLSQQRDEPNATSYDLFCLCQEYYQLRVVSVTAQLTDATHASADVRFTLSDRGEAQETFTYHLGFRLIATDDGWRVDDVIAPTNQDPSLRARIVNDIVAAEQTPEPAPEGSAAPAN